MGKFTTGLRRSSPTILTALGIVGVVGTAVTAVRATPKALRLIKAKKDELETDKLTPMELVQTTWRCYIPSVLIGIGTVTCIVGIGVMDKRNQAALMSAYTMLNESYKQYRKAAKKVYGDDADSKIQAEVAKETYISADGLGVYSADMDPESEKILCYDMFSKRYFTATMAAIVNAQYHINRNLQLRGYTTINEFYNFIGLDGIKYGDEIAWAMDDLMEGGIMWLDFENHRTVMEDGLECCVISAVLEPNKFDGELDIS